jgi:hypothetical protein
MLLKRLKNTAALKAPALPSEEFCVVILFMQEVLTRFHNLSFQRSAFSLLES